METVQVGFVPAPGLLPLAPSARQGMLREIRSAGLDHVSVVDHISFHDGRGFDAIVNATSLLSLDDRLPVHIGVYLLALRHPVTVARQLSTLAEMAPGRLVFGVGVGGEDRHESEVCGVDPRTRGRRTDESLVVLRRLLAGETVTHGGEFFQLEAARITPSPDPPIPFIVGGRSPAALRRTARHGEGWLGIWDSPRRFAAAVEEVDALAMELGRTQVQWRHGLTIWCGFADTREIAQRQLAGGLEDLYSLDFTKFGRYCPAGSPDDVAEFLLPYVDAGCRTFNLIAQTPDLDRAIWDAGAVAKSLREAALTT